MSCARRSMCSAVLVVLVGLLLATSTNQATGQAPRALPAGELPNDVRLEPLKDLNGYFPFTPPASPSEWEARSAEVRRQMLVALGLWPMPDKTPLNAVVHGKVTKDDYTVERVYFESMPGFYVTGSLYRPIGFEGPRPGVLCPHGHWSNGRFYDAGDGTAEEQIKQGAEVTDEAAHSPLQARCVHLARMGCVVFHYDMIGYADNIQISFEVAHRFATQRPHMTQSENWGLFSPQAESHLQSIMGLQSFNSIRALDFLESLSDVDRSRLAVTGASGGGTQTFILAAIDPRPVTAFPAVMVSTAMQGGCTCENCSLLRVGTGNVEIAALFAPKPLGLSAANDWTVEMDTKGFPELQTLYDMLGQPENVGMISRTEFGHNYNHVCRTFMYEWFNKHLELGASTEESSFDRLSIEEMTVWNEEHPTPESGDEFERGLLRQWNADSQSQLAQLTPSNRTEFDAFRETFGGAIDVIIGRDLPESDALEWEQTNKTDQGDHLSITGLLRVPQHGEEIPLTFLYPKEWDGTAVIWLFENGKSGLFDDESNPNAEVQELLDQGICVTGIDMLFQGESLEENALDANRRVENPRESAGYTFGYNRALFAQRVHDVLSAIAFVQGHELTPERVVLVALDRTAPIAVAARVQAADAVDLAAVHTDGFRFVDIDDLHDPYFLPGGAKYADLPGMIALNAPDLLWVAGETEDSLALAEAAYAASEQAENLKLATIERDAAAGRFVDALIGWLQDAD